MKYVIRTMQVDHYFENGWKDILSAETEEEINDHLESPLFYVEEFMFMDVWWKRKYIEKRSIYRNGKWVSLKNVMSDDKFRWNTTNDPTPDNWLWVWKECSSPDVMIRCVKAIVTNSVMINGISECLLKISQQNSLDDILRSPPIKGRKAYVEIIHGMRIRSYNMTLFANLLMEIACENDLVDDNDQSPAVAEILKSDSIACYPYDVYMKYTLETCQADHYLDHSWQKIAYSDAQEIFDSLQSPLFYTEEYMLARIVGMRSYIFIGGEWVSLNTEMPYLKFMWPGTKPKDYETWLERWRVSANYHIMMVSAMALIPAEIVKHAIVSCLGYILGTSVPLTQTDDEYLARVKKTLYTGDSSYPYINTIVTEFTSGAPNILFCINAITSIMQNDGNRSGMEPILIDITRKTITIPTILRAMFS